MFKRFLRAQDGGVAAITAIAMLPLIGITGVVIDYGRAVGARDNLQAATDAAALAGAQLASSVSDNDFQAKSRAALNSVFQVPQGGAVTGFNATRAPRTVTVEAQATVPVMFMKLAGKQSITVKAVSQTVRGSSNNIEIVMALDNTGSMSSNNKMTELKRAAANLVTTLEASASRTGQVKIGIVPFATNVRVNPAASAGYRTASWIDFTSGDGSEVCYNVFGFQWCDRSRANNNVNVSTWRGCIQDRGSPFNTNDGAPVAGNYDSLYQAIQNCPSADSNMVFVQPLTTDYAALRTAIGNMTPGGNTNVTIGVSWGLALLSNQTPFTEAAPFSDKTTQKFLILLTDGENTQDRFDNCGTTNTTCISRMNARTQAACTSVKNAATSDQNPIKVYTVRVVDGDETLLKSCATDPSTYFYDVRSATDLEPAFAAIGNTIANLRLSQ